MSKLTFAERMDNLSGSVIREILKLTAAPGIISLAGGNPAPDSFPIEELKEITQQIYQEQGPQVLQYGQTEGYAPLRQWIADWFSQKGIKTAVENTLIISGSQQGMDLIAKAFLNPGDNVVVENPTFLGATQALKSYQANCVPISSDEDGMQVDLLEEILVNKKPKLIYTIPTFQNPTGGTMTLERRKKLVELSAKYNVPIIEDDPYGALRYEGEELPTLKSLDQAGTVIYLGSASKIVAPGLRVGWAVAEAEIIGKMVVCKQASDVHSSNLSQYIVYNYFAKGVLDAHIVKICQNYRIKRDTMLAAMTKHFPGEAQWNVPKGGLFIWVTLPEGIKTKEILELAVTQKVAFIPGAPFYVSDAEENTLRLNFSNASLDIIEVGIQRIGETIKNFLSKEQVR